jgi:cyanophycinase
MSGLLALVGGAEFTAASVDVERELVERSGGAEVLVLPTAAAFEYPERAVATASAQFTRLGATVHGLMVLNRPDANDLDAAAIARKSRFIYLAGGSPMHLKSVLKDTPLWDAIVGAWNDGAVLAGSSAGAMVLSDPMVDPRGGAFTLGLGLVKPLAVIPHVDEWSHDRFHRTVQLAPHGVPVVAISSGGAALRNGDGRWEARGEVRVLLDGQPADLSMLP